ncbi:MAG: hypothetical protein R3B52_00160 [Candidatus Paceibacterota bacterium]
MEKSGELAQIQDAAGDVDQISEEKLSAARKILERERSPEVSALRAETRKALNVHIREVHSDCEKGAISKEEAGRFIAELPDYVKRLLEGKCSDEDAEKIVTSFKSDFKRAERAYQKITPEQPEAAVKRKALSSKEFSRYKDELRDALKAGVGEIFDELEVERINETEAQERFREILKEAKDTLSEKEGLSKAQVDKIAMPVQRRFSEIVTNILDYEPTQKDEDQHFEEQEIPEEADKEREIEQKKEQESAENTQFKVEDLEGKEPQRVRIEAPEKTEESVQESRDIPLTEEQRGRVDQIMEALEKGEVTEKEAFNDSLEVVDEGRRDSDSITYVQERIEQVRREQSKTEEQKLLDQALADKGFVGAFSAHYETSPDIDHSEQMVRSWVAYKNAPELAKAFVANARDIFKVEHGAEIEKGLEKQLVIKFQKQAIEDIESIGENYFLANELERTRQSIAEKEETIEQQKTKGQEAGDAAKAEREKRKETREELVAKRTYAGAFLYGFRSAYTQVDNEFGDSHSRPIRAVLSGFKGVMGKALDLTREEGRSRLEGYQRREKEALERVHSSEQIVEVERQLLAQLGQERDQVIDASAVLGEVWQAAQKAAQENIRKLLNVEDLVSLERAREKVLALKEVDDPIGILDNFSFNEGEESSENVSEYINGLILQALAKEAISEIQKIEMHGEGPLKKLKNIVQKFGSKVEKDGIESSQARKVLKETFKQFLLSGKSKDRAKTLIFTTFYQQL